MIQSAASMVASSCSTTNTELPAAGDATPIANVSDKVTPSAPSPAPPDPLPVALPLAFLASAATGVLMEWLVLRHLYRRPLDSLLATIGVSFILIQGVRLW